MLSFQILFGLASVFAVIAGAYWLRVAVSRSLKMTYLLDGTDWRAERKNRRVIRRAAIATALTAIFALAGFLVAQSVHVFG